MLCTVTDLLLIIGITMDRRGFGARTGPEADGRDLVFVVPAACWAVTGAQVPRPPLGTVR